MQVTLLAYRNGCVELVDEYQLQVPLKEIRFKWFDTKEEGENYRDSFNKKQESKFTVSANVKEKDGKYGVGYCKAGELLIESIEEATQMLGSPVKITGEYMLGWASEGWAGAH